MVSKARSKKTRKGDSPQIAYDYLCRQIMECKLTPGMRIEERLIVDELGISRTPVRQALMRMASEGLVELLPNRGAVIPPLDLEELRSFFEVFEIVLKISVHLAAKRRTKTDLAEIHRSRDAYEAAAKAGNVKGMIDANEELHLAIAEAGHNSHIVRFVRDLLTKAFRFDGLWYSNQHRSHMAHNIRRSVREHRKLVKVIEAQDVDEAERQILAHVRSFREPFLEYLSTSESENLKFAVDEQAN